jgi:acyl carrier protein
MSSPLGVGRGRDAIVRDTLEVVLGRPIAPDDPVFREDQPDWDSLKHIELVFALEDALGIRFGADEIGELADVASIVDRAERHSAS